MEEKYDSDGALRNWYEGNRQCYLNNQKEQQGLLDKHMLLFASAVFGFSVSISERFNGSLLLTWIIGVVWLLFSISIIAIFFSFRASAKASEDFTKQFDENYCNHEYGKTLSSKYEGEVSCCNEVAFWTNIVGVVLFLVVLCLSSFLQP